MGETVKFPNPGSIEAEAAEWIARLDRGPLTPEDQAALQEWQAHSVRHRETLARISNLWSEFEALKPFATPAEVSSRLRYAISRRYLAYAAAFVLATAVAAILVARLGNEPFERTASPPPTEVRREATNGPPFGNPRSLPAALTEAAIYETAIGVQKNVTLSDGSTILLNTNSRIDVNLTQKKRVVRLDRGEAYFEVVHDAKRPFSVYAGEGVVHDLGTAFDVRVLGRVVAVTVTKGSIELTSLNRRPGAVLARMTAGESAVLSNKVEHIKALPEEALNKRLAWRFGVLVYAGELLPQVVDDISRYTDVKIEIVDPRLNALRVGGYFEVGQTDAMFEALERNFGVRVVRIDPAHVLLSLR